MRILLLLILTISYQLSAISPVHASGSCDTDCTKCHTISTDEVRNILTKINAPDAKILKVQMSPARGLWEVSIDNKGQRGLFYVDFSKKYLISGSIIEVNAAIDKTKERLDALNKDRRINRSLIPLKDALILGDKKATNKVIVFTDPDCPFCGKLHDEIKKVVEKIFNVKVLSVNTINVKSKPKRIGKSSGRSSKMKKAIVTLSKKDKIDFFESTV